MTWPGWTAPVICVSFSIGLSFAPDIAASASACDMPTTFGTATFFVRKSSQIPTPAPISTTIITGIIHIGKFDGFLIGVAVFSAVTTGPSEKSSSGLFDDAMSRRNGYLTETGAGVGPAAVGFAPAATGA